MPQAILRAAKIKSFGNLAGAISHAYRTRPTPNADPAKTNIVIKGCNPDALIDRWHEIAGPVKITESGTHASVLAVDLIISASPEFFRPSCPERAGYWEPEKLDAWRKVMEPAIEEAFPHALSVVLHLDESTPHYTIQDIPIGYTKTGMPRLACKAKYGSDDSRVEGLSKWQDWAGEVMAPLGIERGTPRSQAAHTPIKKYYSDVNDAEQTPDLPKPKKKKPKPLPPRTVAEEIGLTKAHDDRLVAENQHRKDLAAFNADQQRVEQETSTALKKMHAKAVAHDSVKEKLSQQKRTTAAVGAERDALKKVADQLRELPVGEVLQRVYGAELHKESSLKHKTQKWMVNGESVGVTDNLWVFNADGKGGKGAINIVMAVSGVDYRGAIKILSEHFDPSALTAEVLQSQREAARKVVEAAQAEKPPVPAASPRRLQDVIDYLTGERGLPRRLVEAAIRVGKLWADAIGNAVFPRTNGGAFLRSTYSVFKKTIGGKECGGYVIEGAAGGGAYFVESPIDALSVKAANPNAWVCAVGGSLGGFTPSAMPSPPPGERVYTAFDNDKQGQAFALAYEAAYAGAERLTPVGKDWNADIKANNLAVDARWLATRSDTSPQAKSLSFPTGL